MNCGLNDPFGDTKNTNTSGSLKVERWQRAQVCCELSRTGVYGLVSNRGFQPNLAFRSRAGMCRGARDQLAWSASQAQCGAHIS